MEQNNQSRTLYIIQIVTIIALILVLITQALPFFGISVMQKTIPPNLLPAGKGGSYSRPASSQASLHVRGTDTVLVIPVLTLQ